MIFFFGNGRGGCLPVFLVVGFGFLLLTSLGNGQGGGLLLLPLLMIGMFVLVPVLLFRSFVRGATRVAQGPVLQQPRPGRAPSYAPEVGGDTRHQPVHAAEVSSVVARLAHDVATLQVGDDPVARQAMADASERYATASAQLERARSQDQLRTAWLAAAEGLHATRTVRSRLGLDPGPAPALPPTSGPQLQQHARVDVGGRAHDGAPTYEPGYSHWFPGGRVGDRYVPGGWYADAFWPSSLVLGALSGFALGSLMGGALFGGLGVPYDDAGVDGAMADGGWDDVGGGGWDGGGGWGDVGGGSWDGGGGWGDVGGGDFGGGFGDW